MKGFKSWPHSHSYNFSRKAFTKGVLDDVTTRVRGLFVDDQRRIVARSYDKFFNLEEQAETQTRHLRHTLQFPMTLYVKENGFLGILGYDVVTDSLFFSSKSTPESDFSGWFEDILSRQ